MVAIPLGDGFVLVASVPPPTPLERFLNPYGLTLRLGAGFLVAGLLSLLPARSISAPIRTLQEATRKLAEGDLSVRVAPVARRPAGRDRPAWTATSTGWRNGSAHSSKTSGVFSGTSPTSSVPRWPA